MNYNYNKTTMKISTIMLALTALIFVSCNRYEKTKSGMPYKITSAGSKEKAKPGNVVKFDLELKLVGKDTVLQSTKKMGVPGYIIVDTGARQIKYFFTEILTLLGKGDKVDFNLSVDSLVKNKQIPGYDVLFKKGGMLKGHLEVLKIYANENEAKPDYEKEMQAAQEKERVKIEKESASKKVEEEKIIAKYIADKKLNTVKSANGVYVVIEKEGEGAKPDSGKKVMVMYKGYTLDGKVFDKNVEADATHKDPIPVVIGAHTVIPGWEEGLKYFAKGSKGKLIIPFSLGYGAQGSPPVIPPYATLVFDIEVVDVSVPTAADNKATMPRH